jgi:hypothetical protein
MLLDIVGTSPIWLFALYVAWEIHKGNKLRKERGPVLDEYDTSEYPFYARKDQSDPTHGWADF